MSEMIVLADRDNKRKMERSGTLYRQEVPLNERGRSSPAQEAPLSSTSADVATQSTSSSFKETTSSSIEASSARQRTLTAQDVVHKTCFICCGCEDDDDDIGEWIHACTCSLMAHQSCLLTWIAEAQHRSRSSNVPVADRAVKCPSCGSYYKIRQRRITLLSIIEAFEAPTNRLAMSFSAVTLVGGGICASAAYGLLATAVFLGPQAAQKTLGGTLTLSKAVRLASIAPLLVASRTRMIDGLVGSILPLSALLDYETDLPVDAVAPWWPPSPRMSIVLMLLARRAYQTIYKHLWRGILRSVPSPALIQPPGRPIIEIVQAEPVQGLAEANGDARPPVQLEEARMAFSLVALARMGMGALLWPFLSSAAGATLLWLVKPSNAHPLLMPVGKSSFLRNFLGLSDPDVLRVALGWPLSTAIQPEAGTLTGRIAKSLGLASVSRIPTAAPVDPVWWRNAVGGCLIVLAKDFGALLRAFLERRRLASRQIIPVDVSANLDVELR